MTMIRRCQKGLKPNSTKRAGVIEARQRMASALRRTDSPSARSPACHARGCWQVHHQASEGRARGRGVADSNGGLDPGGDVRRSDDVARIAVMRALNAGKPDP